MLKINDGVISLNRGDDVCFTVNIFDDEGNIYALEEGDELLFSVKKSAQTALPVLLSVKSPNNEIYITHADTSDMDVGKYSAAIRLLRRGGDVITVFPILSSHGRERDWNNFIIDPEVAE